MKQSRLQEGMAHTSFTPSRWSGRFALVTGASYGIGTEFCRALTLQGVHVVGCARSVDKIKALASKLADAGHPGVLYPYQCDLTKEAEIVAMFDWIRTTTAGGGVDICVNNAAVNIGQPVLGADPEKLRQMYELNVLALISCANKAVASMRARGVDDGHVFNINSALGHFVHPTMHSTHAYGATKYAVTHITEALREELLMQGSRIRVTGISPAIVDTPMVTAVMGEKGGRQFLAESPTLKAKDVADTLLFALCAPESVLIKEIHLRATGAPD